MANGTIKVSELSAILSGDIDGEDSILISDRDANNGTWYTKRLKLSDLSAFFTKAQAAEELIIDGGQAALNGGNAG